MLFDNYKEQKKSKRSLFSVLNTFVMYLYKFRWNNSVLTAY